jgi:acyl-CoA thioester hydrolase
VSLPVVTHRGIVRPEWVDDNGHMNLAYYLVLFDAGSDAMFEVLGIGHAYREAVGCTSFAAETHIVYEREMREGDAAEIRTTVVGVDEKRLHLAHEMYRAGEAARVALQEILFVSVDLATRRVAPWTAAARTFMQRAIGAAPSKVGRHIALP